MANAVLAPARALTRAQLARWPLPQPGDDADKEVRGHVLVMAGSDEIPGAAVLAAVAALRAGAGKLTMAAPASIAQGLAMAIPESRVIALAQSRGGGLLATGASALAEIAPDVSAVVLGPGMQDERRTVAMVRNVLPLFSHATVVLDALAMSVARDGAFAQPVVLTPHAGEMAFLTGRDKESICAEPLAAAREAAAQWNACVALKGGRTFIVLPDGQAWRFEQGRPGLATSGSGDTLAGLIAGLSARGLPPHAACAWGVMTHARAGAALSRIHGPLGYLARELAGEFPQQLHALHR
ncbi:NAD(P)H-hydrate dehydratase [Variovorax sp. J22R133]|uniref:NAD(P)H-hydrate dehydratase n=1 Tax=Variovorax brevis TaxID=3053503 RepID=UPI0025765525|nr:NAD(P)H-hydrate dehydratase [Variovorax sp. J22R133]MDM0116949.1 NAD(P)H-hydrate dehydratase [Variovorax sp. J22R133]